jgi:hypothetical protein
MAISCVLHHNLKMYKRFLALLAVTLVLVSLETTATAAVKPGTTCKKVGQTSTTAGIKYTCVKSGKKLVWNKGVAANKPAPTPTPTPKPTPTPTVKELTYETELTPTNLAAYKEFTKSYKSRMTSEVPNVEFIVEANMDKVLLKQIVDNINVSAKYFAKERPLNVPLKIWIAMSDQFQWIYDNMTEAMPSQALEGGWLDMKLARAKAEPARFFGGGAAGDTKSGVASLFFNASTGHNWGDGFWAAVPAHEFTHVVQRYELGNTMAPMLCWVREGNANYYGGLIAGRNSQAVYRNFWLQTLSRIPTMGEVPDYQSKSADYWAEFFVQGETKKPTECDPWINYVMGQMAFQYLGGTYGDDAIQSFYLGLRDGWKGVCLNPTSSAGIPCESWKIVFKKSFGATPEALYPKIGQYIADEIKWAKGKQVYWNEEALKIAPIPTD